MKPISTYIRILFSYGIIVGIILFIASPSVLAQSADNMDTSVIEEVMPADEYTEDKE